MPFLRFCFFLSYSLCVSSYAVAQDPFTVAPESYKHQFENDWVRVVRVHYEPGQKIAEHDHPKTETVYVYLNDSGPVRFTHTGYSRFIINRPAVKAGGFRLGPAVIETHRVESFSEQPTDFLRVELKTMPSRDKAFHGRFPPDSHSTTKSSQKVRFENKKVRITRLTCAAQSACGKASRSTLPALLVALTPARLRAEAGDLSLETGTTHWLAVGSSLQLENLGSAPVELLKIEFKTKPASAE